jgi:uncharacterized repeat protein (TIGR03803 family)
MRGQRGTAVERNAILRARPLSLLRWGLVAALLLGCLPALHAQGGTTPSLTTLYNFCPQIATGNCPDGGDPLTGLVQGADGDFYGISQGAGSSNGTVFKITSGGALTTLWSFCAAGQTANCPGGYTPYGPLALGTDGNFYGVTRNGGTGTGYGTVFQITPAGVLTTIYSFCSLPGCSDGAFPVAGLTLGSDGNFYGTTLGYTGGGTVFKVTPTGTLSTLYTFCSLQGCTDGSGPMAPPIEGTDGNFYGTTFGGGASGNGVVYKLTPSGTLTVLYSFCSQSGCLDGAQPQGTLIQATDGNFYGTTLAGGLNVNGGNNGTIFKITPGGTLTTLYLFCSVLVQGECDDGTQPYAGITEGTDGNFYGTTGSGGTGADGGTVYKITPAGAQTVLYSFCSQGGSSRCTDGYKPQDSLVEGSDGNLYGTTSQSGAYNQGTLFRVNTGLTTILVPNVVGQTQAAATAAITGAGLTVGTITQEASTTVAAGDVISQSPAAGTGVGAGTAVALVVSSGPPPPPAPIALAFNPSPATSAVSVTATATITPIATPVTGTVNFTASFNNTLTTVCAQAPVANVSASWQATCAFTEDIPGTYTITATYSGDALNGGNTTSAVLTVNQGLNPVLNPVANSGKALAINANNSPGLQFNAVLNNDSSVSLLVNGLILAGQGCPAFTSLSGGISGGAVYVDFANSTIYLAMFTYNSGLYAAYESINQAGVCTQGPLLQLNAAGLGMPAVELNVDTAQGNMYVLSANGGGLPDPLYLLPTAPWSATSLPVPTQLTLDYSAQYGPIVIDPSNHMVFINDLGSTAYGPAGTYATSGFFVYSPTQSATPANNLQHVVGYVSGATTTPFNVVTLLDNGAGKLVLANENPSASTTNLATPLTILDTTQFSFFSNTQTASSGGVNITPGAGLSTISAVTQYSALGGADIDAPNSVVYAYGFNDGTSIQPGILLEYNLLNPPASAETVLSSNILAPVNYSSTLAWSQLNYNPVSKEVVLSVPSISSGSLGVTSPLCDGNPTLTQLVGNGASQSPIDSPVVNTASGYLYAVEGAGLGTPQQNPGVVSVAPPPAGCGQTIPIQISPATLPAGAVQSTYSQTLTATGGSGAGYTWSVQSGTALSATGLTLSSAGVISGLPTSAETLAPVTVQVTDSAGNTATQSYQLTIYPMLGIVGGPPNGAPGVPYSFTFTGAGGSGSGYTFSVTAGAPSLSALGLSLSTSGTLSGTPPAAGSANFTLQVTDSAGDTAVQSYTILVTSSIVIAPASLPAGTVGIAYSATLIATGGSGSGYVWSVSAGAASLSALGLSLSSAGVLSGTPSAAGQSTFTAQVTDSFGGTATQSYTVVINAAASGSVSVNDPETITVNDSGTSVQLIDVNDATETIHVIDTAIVSIAIPTSIQFSNGPISPIPFGQNFTLTANVVTAVGNSVPTTGAVVFALNGAVISTVPVNGSGSATLTTSVALPVGLNEIDAAYSGGGQFLASQSIAYPVQVVKAATATQLTLNAGPAGYNSTFTATVTPATSGTPTGTVTFYDGSTVLGTATLTSGAATFTTTALPGGQDSVTATYGGDTDYLTSSSNTITQQVASFSIIIAGGGGGVLLPGETASFTVTVTPSNGPYGEPVTLSVNGLPPGAASNFSSVTLTPGSKPVSATLTITAPGLTAQVLRRSRTGLALALLLPMLLPLAVRRRRRIWSGLLLLFTCAGLLTALNGCGTSHGFFLQPPQTYAVTVTAASGTDRQSATLNITVQ